MSLGRLLFYFYNPSTFTFSFCSSRWLDLVFEYFWRFHLCLCVFAFVCCALPFPAVPFWIALIFPGTGLGRFVIRLDLTWLRRLLSPACLLTLPCIEMYCRGRRWRWRNDSKRATVYSSNKAKGIKIHLFLRDEIRRRKSLPANGKLIFHSSSRRMRCDLCYARTIAHCFLLFLSINNISMQWQWNFYCDLLVSAFVLNRLLTKRLLKRKRRRWTMKARQAKRLSTFALTGLKLTSPESESDTLHFIFHQILHAKLNSYPLCCFAM